MATYIVLGKGATTQAPHRELPIGATYYGENYVPGRYVENMQVLGYARHGEGPAIYLAENAGGWVSDIAKLALAEWLESEEGIYMRSVGFDDVVLRELLHDNYEEREYRHSIQGAGK
jgi:hypothetical protein